MPENEAFGLNDLTGGRQNAKKTRERGMGADRLRIVFE
jgi:hypothetical protein